MRSRVWLALGGGVCGLGVALGAFAAHGLKKMLSPYLIDHLDLLLVVIALAR